MLQRSTCISFTEVDQDASKKPITVKNAEVAFFVTFFTVMDSYWHPHLPQKRALKADIDATMKFITVKNMKVHVAFSMLMGFLLASTSASERDTNAASVPDSTAWHVFEVRVTLTIVSGVFQQPTCSYRQLRYSVQIRKRAQQRRQIAVNRLSVARFGMHCKSYTLTG